MEDFKTGRLSLGTVLLSDAELAEAANTLYQDYDMARMFDMSLVSLDEVVNFAVLEHIMRGISTEEEVRRYWEMMSVEVMEKISEVVGREEKEITHLAVHRIEKVVTVEDLRRISPLQTHFTLYSVEEGKLKVSVREPEDLGRWPRVACLMGNNMISLLYLPDATYLDGVDPVSGDIHEPILTQELLDSLTESLFFHQDLQSLGTQTKPPKSTQAPNKSKFSYLDSFSYLLQTHIRRQPDNGFFAKPSRNTDRSLKSARSTVVEPPSTTIEVIPPTVLPKPAGVPNLTVLPKSILKSPGTVNPTVLPRSEPRPKLPSQPVPAPKLSKISFQTVHDIEVLPDPLPPPKVAILHRSTHKERQEEEQPKVLIEWKEPDWVPDEKRAIRLSREECSLGGNCCLC